MVFAKSKPHRTTHVTAKMRYGVVIVLPLQCGAKNGPKLHHSASLTSLPMPVSHKRTISSPCLSLSDTFHIPKLSLNLLSIGQLYELGIDLLFTNHDVDV